MENDFQVSFTEKTPQLLTLEMTKAFHENKVDYNKIANDIKLLSGGKFVLLNTCSIGSSYITRGYSGSKYYFNEASKILGTNILGNSWADKIKWDSHEKNNYKIFPGFSDILNANLDKHTIKSLDELKGKDFIHLIRLNYEGKTYASVMIISDKEKSFDNLFYIEMYLSHLSLFMEKNEYKKQLTSSLNKFNKFFRSNPCPMAVSCASTKKFTEVNLAFLEKTEYSRDEVIGKTSEDLGLFPKKVKHSSLTEYLIRNGNTRDVDLVLKSKSGELLHGLFSGEIIEEDGSHYYLTVMNDITLLKKSHDGIQHLVFRDSLTGLYNRRFFDEEIKRLDVERNLPISIAMIDINRLKLVNDAFGHDHGDNMIKSVSQIIKKHSREDDIIARIGGDEFYILLPKTSSQDTESLLKRISESISCRYFKGIGLSISYGWDTKTDSSQDLEEIKIKSEKFMYRRKISNSHLNSHKAIDPIMSGLYEKNSYEELHSHKVGDICRLIGDKLNIETSRLDELHTLGMLHDIGKIVIKDDILNKESTPCEDEWYELKRHPEVGYQILRTLPKYASISEFVLYHHEKWDGTGYPKGLSGNDIPLESRILSVAETYAAITEPTSYGIQMDSIDALKEIKRYSGRQFDPTVVNALCETLSNPQ